jgi:F-type H+-transporting ATPase subunit gamma
MSVELKGIKLRINSVSQIAQVTSALMRVATARLTRIRRAIEPSNKYKAMLLDILHATFNSKPDNTHPLINERKGKPLLIIIGSERGLCGGFNSTIISALDVFLFDNEVSSVIPVGKIIENRISRMGLRIASSFSMPPEPAREDLMARLLDLALTHFRDPDGGPVLILYTRFISMSRRLPVIEPLLPIPLGHDITAHQLTQQPAWHALYAHEPPAPVITDRIIPEVLRQLLENAILNSIGSEDASRQESMTRASSNADDMLTDLKLTYSRLRQEIITRDIIDIIGAGAAVTANRT